MGCQEIRVMIVFVLSALFVMILPTVGSSENFKDDIYPVPTLKPHDSVTTLKVGDQAPDFTLPSVEGSEITLSDYYGKKNVVISFVPAAWTPVCSDQWPGYNLARGLFEKQDAVLLGITVDNVPTLYAWCRQMGGGEEGLWFPVLSDFFPHGAVAQKYGVLRSEGVTERALFLIDKRGIIRYMDIHDINTRPHLDELAKALEEVNK